MTLESLLEPIPAERRIKALASVKAAIRQMERECAGMDRADLSVAFHALAAVAETISKETSVPAKPVDMAATLKGEGGIKS